MLEATITSENLPVFLHPCVALLILMGNARIAGSRNDREGSAVEDRRPQDSRRSDGLAEVFQITQFGGWVQGVHYAAKSLRRWTAEAKTS
jgi:hypothetical protein